MPDDTIIYRELSTDAEHPLVQVPNVIAEIEGKEATELPSMWDHLGGVLDGAFSTPPAEEAQLVIQFCYHGYRVTIQQNGRSKFVKAE